VSALLTSPVATRVTGSRARRFLALAVLMLPVLLISVDNTILSFALPSISRALNPDATTQLWIVDAYPLVLAGLLVVMGSIGDRIGRRRILVIGATGFALFSVAAAFATDAWMLVAARIAMGVFGAMLMPATLSIIRNVFVDAGERRMALAVWSTMFAAGNALGPLVGGALLAHFHWGSVFLVAVPILVLMLVGVPFCVPESRDPLPGPRKQTTRHYVLCDRDRAILPAAQRAMLDRAPVDHLHHRPWGHSPFQSDPQALADLIDAIAR